MRRRAFGIHQSPSAIFTFLHEAVEADWKAGMTDGTFSHAETQRAIASIADRFDPNQARSPGEKALAERVQRIAQGQATAAELRETVSELAVADVMGRLRDGSPTRAGGPTAALDAAALAATEPGAVKEIGKLRGFFRAARTYLRSVFGTALELRRAKQEGRIDPHAAAAEGVPKEASRTEPLSTETKLGEGQPGQAGSPWEAFARKLLGVDGAPHRGGEPMEGGPEGTKPPESGTTFSLAKADPKLVEKGRQELQSLADNPERAARESHNAHGVPVISADDFVARTEAHTGADLSQGIALAPELKQGANLVRRLTFEHLLKTTEGPVIFLAGGQGSGKSTFSREVTPGHAAFVMDTMMNNVEGAAEWIRQARDAGHDVLIRFVLREPGKAMEGNLARAEDTKRVVSAEDLARAHVEARAALPKLQEMFAEDPGVQFRISRTVEGGAAERVQEVPQMAIDEARRQAYAAVDAAEKDQSKGKEIIAAARGDGQDSGRHREAGGRENPGGEAPGSAGAQDRAGELGGAESAPKLGTEGAAGLSGRTLFSAPEPGPGGKPQPGTKDPAAGGLKALGFPIHEDLPDDYRAHPDVQKAVRQLVDEARPDFAFFGVTPEEVSAEDAIAANKAEHTLSLGLNGKLYVTPERFPNNYTKPLIRMGLREELIHAAWIDVLRDWHRKLGQPGQSFDEYAHEHTQQVFEELQTTPEGTRSGLGDDGRDHHHAQRRR